MDAKIKLPAKPNLELVATAFGLDNYQESTQIETIFQHQHQSGLKLYLPTQIILNVQLASHGTDVELDGEGYIGTEFSYGESQHFSTTSKLIEIGNCQLRTNDYGLVVVRSVFVEGIEYLILDETGAFVEPIVLPIKGIFALRNELKTLINEGIREIPSYADSKSEHYAPKLALVCELHQKVRVEGEFYKGNMRNAVDKWLQINKPDLELSNALKDQLSAMINNKKLGK